MNDNVFIEDHTARTTYKREIASYQGITLKKVN